MAYLRMTILPDFSLIDPEEFNNTFFEWQKQLHDYFGHDIIVIER